MPAWLLAVPWLLYETSLWWSVPGAFPLGVDHAPGHVAHVLGALVGVAAGFPLAKRIGEFGRASQPRAGGGRPQVYSAERVMQLRARGADDEAFAMLASEVAKSARNREAVLLYFEMAVDRGEAKKVAPYVLRLIREELRRGARDQAIAHWAMLTNNEPDALLDPTTLVDLLPDIRASKGAAAAAVAVQQATRHDNPGLSTVLAATIARFAEDLDPDVATHAAKRALSANDLPATGRAELEGIVERLREDYQEPLPPPVVTAEVAPDVFYEAQDRSLFGEAAELSETVREVETFPGVHVSEAVPRLLEDDGLEMEVSGRGPARLAYDRLRGVAVAGVRGVTAKPIVLLDLLLDGPEPTTTPLRVVRFRSDCYDPRVLVSVSGAPLDALLGLVAEIVKRARVLPISEVTAANQIATFESLDEYQLRVLRVAKPSEA